MPARIAYDPNDPAYQKKLAEREEAVAVLMKLFKDNTNYPHPMLAWLRIFDKNMDLCVTYDEFCEGMSRLWYRGDSTKLLERLDIDGVKEIMLEEIDPVSAKLWMKFRMWCACHFEDAKDMMFKLNKGKNQHVCGKHDFIDSIKKLAWDGGNENLLFECLNKDEDDVLSLACLIWFAKDKQKQRRKEHARRFTDKQYVRTMKERQEIAKALDDFKSFLKKRYRTCLRAWRSALDQDGSMSIQKPELLQAVNHMDWSGNAKLLWKALDTDGSGLTTLQELDLQGAERLAKFKEFTRTKFGSATEAFQAFDIHGKGKLREEEFIDACRKQGFPMTVALFHGLDWQKNTWVRKDDLAFLDTWRCPTYLTCKPSAKAAQEFKTCLLKQYPSYTKAWRACLDPNNSNRVDWGEFQYAAKRVRFTGDLAGAWRALDDDLSGFISLREIDMEASHAISEFKCWADSEFGGARLAFKAFDANDSLELSLKEWRKACMSYAYQGDSRAFFDALDADRSGRVTLNEIAFIDTWELTAAQLAEVEIRAPTPEPVKPTVVRLSQRLLKLAQPLNPRVKKLVAEGTGVSQDSCFDETKLMASQSPSAEMPLWNPASDPEYWMKFHCGLSTGSRPVTPLVKLPPRAPLNPSALAKIDALKGEILQEPIMQKPKEAWNESHECNHFDIALRQKTVDLRSRTVSLLEKVERIEREFPSIPVSLPKQSLGSARSFRNGRARTPTF